jgi:hypothetical protein
MTEHLCDFDDCERAPTGRSGPLQLCAEHLADYDALTGATYSWRVREADRNAEPYPAEARHAGTLEQAIAVAQAHVVDIDLFDVAGFRRGWVHADGNWRLT